MSLSFSNEFDGVPTLFDDISKCIQGLSEQIEHSFTNAIDCRQFNELKLKCLNAITKIYINNIKLGSGRSDQEAFRDLGKLKICTDQEVAQKDLRLMIPMLESLSQALEKYTKDKSHDNLEALKKAINDFRQIAYTPSDQPI